jgi:predicted polyphosphate/ATP-dependent NAD kinase
MKKVGLIINPVAGMGGAVGLKGTDGEALAQAIDLGARPTAGVRAVSALQVLKELADEVAIYCYSGEMGETAVRQTGLDVQVIGTPNSDRTSDRDTKQAARLLLEHGMDLLILVGGDGTARDIETVVGLSLPVVAVPAGVKCNPPCLLLPPRRLGVSHWNIFTAA